LESSRTPEEKEKDESINIGGPHNLLDIKDEKDVEKIPSHAIVDYRKWSEALSYADNVLTVNQKRLDDLISGKVEKKTETQKKEEADRTAEDKYNVPEPDDIVTYVVNGQKFTGVVDHLDENNDYVIIPKIDDKTFGEPVTISKDNVTLDTKTVSDGDISEEPVDNAEVPILYAEVGWHKVSVDISYYHGKLDTQGNFIGVPVVRNEDLHRFL